MTLRITDPSQLAAMSDAVRRQVEPHVEAYDREEALDRLRSRAGLDRPSDADAGRRLARNARKHTPENAEAADELERRPRRNRPEQEAGRLLIAFVDHYYVIDPVLGRIRVGDYFAHTPNGGARSAIEAAIFRGQGVREGWPDYTLYLPRGRWHGAVLELKADEGSKPDREQLEILARLERAGYRALVAWGFEQAREALINYVEGGR